MRSAKKVPINVTMLSARVKIGKKTRYIHRDSWDKFYIATKTKNGSPKYYSKKTKFTKYYQDRMKFGSVENALEHIKSFS